MKIHSRQRVTFGNQFIDSGKRRKQAHKFGPTFDYHCRAAGFQCGPTIRDHRHPEQLSADRNGNDQHAERFGTRDESTRCSKCDEATKAVRFVASHGFL